MEQHEHEQRQEDHSEAPETGRAPLPVSDVRGYLEALLGRTSTVASLDRSKHFRYPQDTSALAEEAREALRANRRLSLLVIGVGNLEEPQSSLATLLVEARKANKSLRDLVDLHLVEIRERQEIRAEYGWGKMLPGGVGTAFLTPEQREKATLVPMRPPSGLEAAYRLDPERGEYVFQDELRELLEECIADPERARFGTPVENFLAEHPGTFDVVSCNNVLQHVGGVEGYASPFKDPDSPKGYDTYARTVRGILELAKPGGLLLLHTDGAGLFDTKGRATAKALATVPDWMNLCQESNGAGIYRRVHDENTPHTAAASTED